MSQEEEDLAQEEVKESTVADTMDVGGLHRQANQESLGAYDLNPEPIHPP